MAKTDSGRSRRAHYGGAFDHPRDAARGDPRPQDRRPLPAIGQRVRAGVTPIARYVAGGGAG